MKVMFKSVSNVYFPFYRCHAHPNKLGFKYVCVFTDHPNVNIENVIV